MAKRTETKLVVSAEDLSTKKLKDIAKTFRAIREAQRDTQGVSDRTKVTFKELEATVRQLDTVLAELAKRKAAVENVRKLGESAQQSRDKLNGLEKELAALRAATDEAGKKTEQFKAKQAGLVSEIKRTQKALNSVEESYRKQSASVEAAGLNAANAERDISRLLAVTSRAAKEARGDVDALAREQRQYRDELARVAAEEERIKSARLAAAQARVANERGVQSGFAAFSRNASSLTAAKEQQRAQELVNRAAAESVARQERLRQVEAQLDARRLKSVGTLGRISAALRNAAGATGQLARSTAQASLAQQRANKATLTGVESQRTALSLSQRIRGQLLSIAASYVGIFGAISTGQKAIDVYNQRLALNTRLLVANDNNAKAAAEDYQFLRDTANRLGFSLTDLGTGYSKLAIAGKAAGFTVDETRQVFESFSEVTRVFNLSTEESARVFTALEQVLSKGKVQAEELRGQLGDVLPGAYTAFGRALQSAGVIESLTDLDKLLEQGKVSARALIPFSQQYAQLVQGQLGPASNNLQAQLGRLRTAWDDFLQTVAQKGLVEAVRGVANELNRFLAGKDGAKLAQDLADGLRAIGRLAIGAARNFGLLVNLAKAFVGIAIGKAFFQLGTSIVTVIGPLARARAALLGVAAAETTAAVATRGLLATLGPIGLALAAVGLAWAIFDRGTSESADAASRAQDEIDKLNSRLDEAASSLFDANKAQDDYLRAKDELTRALKAEEAAKAKLTKAGTAEAQTAYDQAKAKREEAKARADNAKKVAEEAEAKRKAAIREIEETIKIAEKKVAEAQARAQTALAKLAEARANAAIIQSLPGQNDGMGGRAAAAGAAVAAQNSISAAAKRYTQEAEAAKALLKALDDLRKRQKDLTTQTPISAEGILLEGGNDPKKPKDDAKRRAEEAKRLAEEASRFLLDVRRDGLQQQVEDEKKALQAKLDLLKIEYDEKIKAADELTAKLRAAGQQQAAEAVARSKAEIETQRSVAEQRVREESASKSLKEEIEKREAEINRIIEDRQRVLDDIERRKNVGVITDLQAANETAAVEKERFQTLDEFVKKYLEFLQTRRGDAALTEEDIKLIDEQINKVERLAAAYTPVTQQQTKLRELQEQVADGLTDTLVALGEGIAGAISGFNSFGDAIKGAWDVFRNFIADFLVGIGKAILKVILLNAIQKAFGQDSILGKAAGLLIGGSAHTGGIVGQQAKNRSLSPALFAAAQRYHTGGVVGLAPNEVPIVAKRGEEVLTETDPRHRNNGGMSGQNIKIINAIDSASVVQEGLNSPAGTRSILNVVRANKAAFKSALA